MKARRRKRKIFSITLPARALLLDGQHRMSAIADLFSSNPRTKPRRERLSKSLSR
jgi:hypothetical protein